MKLIVDLENENMRIGRELAHSKNVNEEWNKKVATARSEMDNLIGTYSRIKEGFHLIEYEKKHSGNKSTDFSQLIVAVRDLRIEAEAELVSDLKERSEIQALSDLEKDRENCAIKTASEKTDLLKEKLDNQRQIQVELEG